MRILSFNASTPNLHACLAEGSNIVAEQIIVCDSDNNKTSAKNTKSRQFAASLIIPAIADLLKKANWSKSSIEAIVVGIGPGSFTGIRIAVVTARTLAQALSLPLLGINEFECYAFREQIKEFPTAIALNAGKKQYYCAHIHSGSSLLNEIDNKVSKQHVNWHMTTHYGAEENFHSHLTDFKQVLMLSETPSLNAPGPVNQAANQAILAHNRLEQIAQSSEPLDKIFPYHLVKPLYIRNASITISSVEKANKL